MATHQDYLFRKNLSRAMSELLADPFSELTRNRQIALLIAATIAPLLSSGLVKVKEAEVGGTKFELTAPHLAIWLAVAITGDLFISYILTVWADLSIAKVKRWSPLAKIGNVKAEIDADIKAQMEAATARSEEAIRLSDELDKIDGRVTAKNCFESSSTE